MPNKWNIFSCVGKKSRRSKYEEKDDEIVINDDEDEEPVLHFACRSNDPKNLKFIEASREKKGKATPEIESTNNNEKFCRPYISDRNVPWDKVWQTYTPVNFTSQKILDGPNYADPQYVKMITKWNNIDGKIDRRSFTKKYEIKDNYPLNPIGRTGITGRGHLGRWGPNHAGDPIVTRWKKENGEIVKKNGKPVLQFVSIQRKDTKEWAIPGGMVDPGEKITSTLKREFMEEATNSIELKEEEKNEIEKFLNDLFSSGVEVYRGYVDDPRNTDNSWMETTAYNFHDKNGNVFDRVKLAAGDDASKVKWMDIDNTLKLYASHKDFIQKTAELHNAFW